MATFLSVHGTFAHWDDGAKRDGTAVADELWWKSASPFEKTLCGCVTGIGADGKPAPLNVERFIWGGDNSEMERRAAAAKLLVHMQGLEARGENYVVVGHSHGGSVISTALLNAAAANVPLDGMKRWVTVGTPFINMRPLPRLVDRLNLIQRVLLVASMMLLMMYLVYIGGQYIHELFGKTADVTLIRKSAKRDLLAALMMSVPAIIASIVFLFMDRRNLFYYRRATIARARALFGAKWLSFCHASDEAVQGLKSAPSAKISLFGPTFAAQRLTFLAVLALPLAYLIMLSTPSIMVGVANFLKNSIYHVDKYAVEGKAFEAARKQIRDDYLTVRKQGGTPQTAANADWNVLRQRRNDLKQRFPDFVAISRALRFQREFFEVNGVPCPGGILCGGGDDFAINSRLLFHIVTDDVTSGLINDDTRLGIYTEAARTAFPVVVVPLVFGALALGVMVVFSVLARVASRVLAYVLNRVTFTEIKRELFGNDTEGEVAVGVEPHPAWLKETRPYLPAGIAKLLTAQADTAAAVSIAKFRNALSIMALAASGGPSGGPSADAAVSNYLSWRELIHSAYFDLPQFQVLIARMVSNVAGFAPTAAFQADPLFAETQAWLQQIDVVVPVGPPQTPVPGTVPAAVVLTPAASPST